MFTRMRVCVGALVLTLGLCGRPVAAGEAGRLLLVNPPRQTVVQVAFGVSQLRPVYLVAYDTRLAGGGCVLHFWDEVSREWIRMSAEEFRTGALLNGDVARVVIVGADKDVPAEVAAAAAGLGTAQRVPSLLVRDLVNALNESLKFAPSEWRWLAKEYGLQIKDLNEDRRRYGRYGPPGARPGPQPAPEAPLVPVIEPTPAGEPAGAPTPEPVAPLPQDK
jgi:hypothetical protein